MRNNPLLPQIPENYKDLYEVFGDIRKFIRPDGTLDPRWEKENVVRIKLPSSVVYAYDPKVKITQITVHRKLEPVATLLYAKIWDLGIQEDLGPYGGGFVFRSVRNRDTLSTHSWAISWDWNPAGFPLGSNKRRTPALTGVFKDHGFMMGEDFKNRKDPMHMQYAFNI